MYLSVFMFNIFIFGVKHIALLQQGLIYLKSWFSRKDEQKLVFGELADLPVWLINSLNASHCACLEDLQ